MVTQYSYKLILKALALGLFCGFTSGCTFKKVKAKKKAKTEQKAHENNDTTEESKQDETTAETNQPAEEGNNGLEYFSGEPGKTNHHHNETSAHSQKTASIEISEKCVGFIKTINQEALLYHIQGKIKQGKNDEERLGYLEPRWKVYNGEQEENQSEIIQCAASISAIESFPELKRLQTMEAGPATKFLTEKIELLATQVKYPVRSCLQFIDTLRDPIKFRSESAKLQSEDAVHYVQSRLERFNTAGENLAGKVITPRGCLDFSKSFASAVFVSEFFAAGHKTQNETLMNFAAPEMLAH